MNTNSLPIIDEKRLNEGAPELVKEIYGMLKKQLPESQRLLNAAVAAKNWQDARSELHKLQGSCAYCGLMRLGVAVTNLYNAIKNLSPPYQEHLDRFNTEIEAVIGELNRISK